MPTTPETHPALTLLNHHAQSVDTYLQSFLTTQNRIPPRLLESIAYSLLTPGKRLRPALVLEFAQATEIKRDGSFLISLSLAAAAAIEMIHTFSLVHDDLPAMDDDDLRRGRPTNHIVFGQALAILAGDALTTLPFELLSTPHPDSRESTALTSLQLIHELATATGPQGMIGGQTLDIDSENKSLSLPDLQSLHRMKTGALLRAACRMGVVAANGSPAQLAAATRYGEHLGLAFQITDDLLDLTATPATLGKATQKDAAKGKNTYPSLLGVDAAKQQAHQEVTAALISLDLFGDAAQGLRQLADFVLHRTR